MASGGPRVDFGENVHVRDDGRIGALLVDHNPAGDGPDVTDYTAFVEDGDQFLIDVVFLS